MSNSVLVTYTNLTKNHSGKRTHAIDTITIHCFVGQVTAKRGCDYFATTDRDCSANYVIGKDGDIGLSVEECNRSWCSGNAANDQRAITIEVASDTTHPYAVTDAAYEALIKLCADICKRNSIKQLLWKGDKSLIGRVDKQNMTVHRWFENKACPGEYLYERHGEIAERVNKLLGETNEEAVLYRVQVGAFRNRDYAEAMLAKVQGAGFTDAFIVVEGEEKQVEHIANKKSDEEIATEVIAGKWSNGTERKERLEAAGYDYATIQRIVNDMYKK